MNREQKQQEVERLREALDGARFAFLIDYKGVTVPQVSLLRRQVRDTGSRYAVIKNTLLERAVAGSPLEVAIPHLKGPTAVAWNTEDPVALAKALKEFTSKHPIVSFKAAVIDGQLLPGERVQEVAALPGPEELKQQLVYVLASPMRRLATVLSGPSRNLALVLKQRADQLG